MRWCIILLPWVLTDTTTNDYLQPYKFVKPLKDLEELYNKHSSASEHKSVKVPEIELEKMDTEETVEKVVETPSKLQKKILMTDSLEVPAIVVGNESLPVAQPQRQPLRDLRGKARKRLITTSRLGIKEKKDEEKTEEDKEESEEATDAVVEAEERLDGEVPGPKAEPLRSRMSDLYYDEDEYYYYYDDYEDYDDRIVDDHVYRDIGGRRGDEAASSSTRDHPPKSPTRPRATPPPTRPPTTTKPTPRPTSRYTKPKSSLYEHKYSHKPRDYHSSSNTHHRSPEYNLASTLERLKAIRKSQELKRNGVPSLPNPWERINQWSSGKSGKKDYRKPTSSWSRPKPKTTPKTPPPSSAEYEYYYDDYYTLPLKRQGYAEPRPGSNPLALLVAPLAGIALLTAAAAVAINPVLVTVSVTGKRKKRDLDTVIGGQGGPGEGISPELEEKIHEMQVLEKFMSSVPDNVDYQQQVLSMYLSCSGYTDITNSCLDRVVCEYANEESQVEQEERDVISIVLYNIMANQFVSEEYKDRLRVAARAGRDTHTCLAFECSVLTPDLNSNLLD